MAPRKKKAVIRRGNRNPIGRPTLYRVEFCQMLIDHMSKGLSIEAFAGTIFCGKRTIFQWLKDHSEFQHAKQIGESKSRLWWEKAGMTGMKKPAFSSSVWIFNMKNRHGWVDKKETKNDQAISTVRIELPGLQKEQVVTIQPDALEEGEDDGST